MPFRSEIYRVLIASPSDLTEERQVATEAINDWNAQHSAAESIVLLPVRWETHALPQAGVRPQQAINDQLVNKSDILIGMFWTKFGTDTGVAESGTVEEIDQFVAAGKPAMLYFSNRPINPDKIDPDQHAKLKKFQQETYKNALVGKFSDPTELRQILLRDLVQQVRSLKSKSDIHREEDAIAEKTRSESLESAREILEDHAHAFRTPRLLVSLGPKLAYRQIATREELFSFISLTAPQNQIAAPEQRFDSDVQMNALFLHSPIKRYERGIYAFDEAAERDSWSRRDGRVSTTKFVSFDQYGFVMSQIAFWERTYYTRFNPGGGPAGATNSFYFWHSVLYLRHILSWAEKFYEMFPPRTGLILRVGLEQLRGRLFKLTDKVESPHEAALPHVATEDLGCPSDGLKEQIRPLVIEVCYQLLWNLGGDEPPNKTAVEQYVDRYWDGRE
jgi:hypothetical protein